MDEKMKDTSLDMESTAAQDGSFDSEDFDFDALGDLGEFSTESTDSINLEDEQISLAEDVTGFAKGFPNWALHPPKDL